MWIFISSIVVCWIVFQLLQMKSMQGDIKGLKAQHDTLLRRLIRLESEPGEPKLHAPEAKPDPVVKSTPVASMDTAVEMAPPPLPSAPKPVRKPDVSPAPMPSKPAQVNRPVLTLRDESEDKWSHWEKVLGLKWTTWVGALILFLGAALFVKYSFDRAWLGPWTKVGLSTLAGCAVLACGEWGLRRKMIWLGQGLVGIGLAILYIAAFSAYAFYELLPHPAVFAVMMVVTVMGMAQAIRHNALPIAFLAVLGGFLTPLLLSRGEDARDALFAYVLLLDLGVLAVAWFKRWRALDVLAFCGTLLLFMGWFHKYETTARLDWVPTVIWLVAFYAVFLVVPFLYHLRRATPVTGERFFLAVTNAVGLFGGLYTVLHGEHRGLLSVMTVGMSGAYLAMGLVIHQRIKEDVKAMWGCAALFVSLLTLSIPIALDLHGVTVAWAVEAPLLLFLAYLYPYKPVRVGSVVPWSLAVARLFIFHWPMHSEAFTLCLNSTFGTAAFVVLAGGAFAGLCHRYAKENDEVQATPLVGLAAAFLGLFVVHNELWLWLGFEGHRTMQCWLTSLVWTAGAVGFGWLCWKGRRSLWYLAGVMALGVSGMLCLWAYSSGARGVTELLVNGRFIASAMVLCVLGAFGALSRALDWDDRFKTFSMAERTYVLCAVAAACLCHGELFFWLSANKFTEAMSWALPLIWVLAGVGTLALGQRFGLKSLRAVTLAFATVASCWMVWHYTERMYHPGWLFLNLRFAVASASVALFFAYGSILRRFEKQSVTLAEGLYILCALMAACLCHGELLLWLSAHNFGYAIRWAVPWIWVFGGAGVLVWGQREGLKNLRSLALAFGAVASVLVVWSFAERLYHPGWLFVNLRFIAGLASVGLLMAYGFTIRQYEDLNVPEMAKSAFGTFVAAVILLFLCLNVETYLFTMETIPDGQQARLAAHMAISLVWGVYASGLLVFGFAKRVRVARLSALGLFGVTALKLVFVDLAGVQEVYRIISFVVLGLLIIAASYLYHRAEKQLTAQA